MLSDSVAYSVVSILPHGVSHKIAGVWDVAREICPARAIETMPSSHRHVYVSSSMQRVHVWPTSHAWMFTLNPKLKLFDSQGLINRPLSQQPSWPTSCEPNKHNDWPTNDTDWSTWLITPVLVWSTWSGVHIKITVCTVRFTHGICKFYGEIVKAQNSW